MTLPGEHVKKRWPRTLAAGFGLLIAAVVLFLIVGTMRDPTFSLHAVLGSMAWATVGPHLVLFSLVALGLGIAAFRYERGLLAKTALIFSITALLGSTYITARIVTAAVAAGGSVNPLSGLLLESMSKGGPDELIAFRTS